MAKLWTQEAVGLLDSWPGERVSRAHAESGVVWESDSADSLVSMLTNKSGGRSGIYLIAPDSIDASGGDEAGVSSSSGAGCTRSKGAAWSRVDPSAANQFVSKAPSAGSW